MPNKLTEDDVHNHLYKVGLGSTILPCPEIDDFEPDLIYDDFKLWKIVKSRALQKLKRLHYAVRYGEFLASKLKLPIDKSRPMELDLFGYHEDGLFVLELKVDRAAERNAFSELLGYSYYIAEMHALSGTRDITNILVANLDAKITRQAFLYDLLVSDRDVIVYKPIFPDGSPESLQLELHIPSDDEFRHLTNELLSHDSMACVVVTIDDLKDWFDNEEENSTVNWWTKEHLDKVSNYCAQLMEAEGLHGFCFIRKPWREMPWSNRSSLIICALNPFRIANPQRANSISSQLTSDGASLLREIPTMAFDGRLLRLGNRAIKDTLTHSYRHELETAVWAHMVTSFVELVATHNFGFRPVGMFREAYSSFLNNIYAREENGTGGGEDISTLKINELTNWMRAWMFMESCGFAAGNVLDEQDDDPEDFVAPDSGQ